MHMAEDPTPWYRQFWPWFVIAFPASAVMAGIATLIIAIQTSDGMVVDDYYKEGLAINQQLERHQQAAALGIAALIRFNSESGTLSVDLSAAGLVQEESLTLQLIHPTLADQDQTLVLKPAGGNRYSATTRIIGKGNWHVILEPGDRAWRLAGRMGLPEQSQVYLKPGV